jgi:tRNA pseudouridine55 synthase
VAAPDVRGRNVRGILLLDKPRGMTSNRALQRVKRIYRAAKAGHTGSLDPLATGMLPICFGSATRLGGYLLDAGKEYRVTAQLGVATDSGDADGAVTERRTGSAPSEHSVHEVLARFVGEIAQIPPMYSALKHDGVRLYRLARRGVTVPRAERRVTIHGIDLVRYEWPELELTVRCSKGTYVRSLVADIAAALGTVGHVVALRRLAVDPFGSAPLTTLEQLEATEASGGTEALDRLLLPADRAVATWPRVELGPAATERLMHGQSVEAGETWQAGRVRVYTDAGSFIAIGDVTEDRRLVPRRVFTG